jgi:hypothetical protein
MASFHSFAQLLEKKIRRELEREMKSPSNSGEPGSVASMTRAEAWTRLVGNVGTFRFESPNKAQAYHQHRTPPKPRPPHLLTESQRKAFEFFQGALEVPLQPHFSATDLQKAFRQLALRFHPDHGGTNQSIQSLIAHRRDLEKLFEKS